jgi:uncharacterized membrane protein
MSLRISTAPRGLLARLERSREALPAEGTPVAWALAVLGGAAIVAIITWWTWRALHDPGTNDLGLAYEGGQVNWQSGHPEALFSWIGTPFLASAMSLVSRVLTIETATKAITILNLVVTVAVVGYVLRVLRPLLARPAWWVLAFALVSFGPLMSTVWWKQFNIIALALALCGFELMRRERPGWAGLLIALSVSIKPLAFLLVPVLLVPRTTRRTALISIGWIVVLNFAALGLSAVRAHDAGVLNPYVPLHNFSTKSAFANGWSSDQQNFAPGSLLAQLVGGDNWTVQHLVVYAFVAFLGIAVFDTLRGVGGASWETFAFTLPLSAMLSTFEWSHYQILLAPLLVLLYVRFLRDGSSIAPWCGLIVAFLLCSLIWAPYGTSVGAVRALISSKKAQTIHDLYAMCAIAQFAQYILVGAGLLWYARHWRAPTAGRPSPQETEVARSPGAAESGDRRNEITALTR